LSNDLRTYADGQPDDDELDRLFMGLRSQGPRGVAVIIARELEDNVRQVLEANGIQVRKRATFSDAIELAFKNTLIGPKIKHDLDVIRDIRNAMAHSARALSFNTPPIEVMCRSLNALKGHEEGNDDPQDAFIWASLMLVVRLVQVKANPKSVSTFEALD
jgi:hypothetical protein